MTLMFNICKQVVKDKAELNCWRAEGMPQQSQKPSAKGERLSKTKQRLQWPYMTKNTDFIEVIQDSN